MDAKLWRLLASGVSWLFGLTLIAIAMKIWAVKTVEWIVSQYALQWQHFMEGIQSMPAGVPIAILGIVLVWVGYEVRPWR